MLQNETLDNIIHNPQATHNQLLVNSVAMLIQQLIDAELGKIPPHANERLLTARNTRWLTKSHRYIESLLALSTENFFKPGEMDLPENEALKKEIELTWVDLRKKMIEKMSEPINPFFDIVTLFYPNPDEDAGFIEKKVELPLRTVLPLLINAYLDDAKFAHNYSGNPDEQLKQAKQDRPIRLISLFRCFQRVQGLCHTGVRNELILLLNKIYKGVDLIEDLKATMQYFLSDNIDKQLWVVYEQAIRFENHRLLNELKIGYLQWMTDGNPSSLLALIDPQHEIKTKLDHLIIAHGSDPHRLSVKYGDAGCELYFKPARPVDLSTYKDSYIFINTAQLIYVNRNGEHERVTIHDMALFRTRMAGINPQALDQISLNNEQIRAVIKENGGHIREAHISYDDYFARLTEALAFSTNGQHHRILNQITFILNENSHGDTPKHRALDKTQSWINKDFVFNLNADQTSVHDQCVSVFQQL